MRATRDFSAQINGVVYALKKGQVFKGDARAEAHLKACGLLAEPARRAVKEGEDK